MPRKPRKIQSNRTILIWAFRFIFASAKINRRALRGSAIAPFLRNIPAMEGGGYNSIEFLKKLEDNFCTRKYENWRGCPSNP